MKSPVQPLRIGILALGWTLVCLGSWLAGCSIDEALPSAWVLGPTSKERLAQGTQDPKAAEQEILRALESLFGTATAPHWPLGDSQPEGAKVLAQAAQTYREECSHCHGLEGYGNGPSSQFIQPKPWNFALGVFPRSAPDGSEPKLPALVTLLENGIASSSMPHFARLGKPVLMGVAGHVLLLLKRTQVETKLVDAYLQGGPGSLTPERVEGILETWSAGPQSLAQPGR
ncbi:MAG: hypothetical protein H6830_00090 [Planctomycetes bacterium]|nr:hypothetical protein [Planctomycetota bacterium]MCB9906097.1 hypothetical protein [Planctomycetota bacterium]MCB9910733.1 hypothetical protein [Planctomycetota bacterium]MCB9912759.1 hypothetical protein [Planctomycetota bacterium]